MNNEYKCPECKYSEDTQYRSLNFHLCSKENPDWIKCRNNGYCLFERNDE